MMIKRVNGYLDFNAYFFLHPKLMLLSRKTLKYNERCNYSAKLFTKEDLFYFKTNGGYEIEVLMEEIYKLNAISCAHYDLAIFGNKKGCVSKNFIEPNEKYISLEIIMKDYYAEINKNKFYQPKYNDINPHGQFNLYDIWNALEFRFKMDISEVMKEICQLFQMQLIYTNLDLRGSNVLLEISNGTPHLGPYIDSEDCLSFGWYFPKMKVTENGFSSSVNAKYIPFVNGDFILSAMQFLRESSTEFVDDFQKLLFFNHPDLLKRAIVNYEKKVGIPFSDSQILTNYESYYNDLTNATKNYFGKGR